MRPSHGQLSVLTLFHAFEQSSGAIQPALFLVGPTLMHEATAAADVHVCALTCHFVASHLLATMKRARYSTVKKMTIESSTHAKTWRVCLSFCKSGSVSMQTRTMDRTIIDNDSTDSILRHRSQIMTSMSCCTCTHKMHKQVVAPSHGRNIRAKQGRRNNRCPRRVLASK